MMPMWRRAGGICRRGVWRRMAGNLEYQILKLKWRWVVRGNKWRAPLAAASATQFESTCPTREEGNPQNEAKLDEHVRIAQTQENEHVVAEFGVDLGLDNGVTKPNLEGDSGGVEGKVREPEAGIAAGVPVRVEKRSKKGDERRLRREMWRREMERRGAADRAKLAMNSEQPGGENNGGRGPPS